MRKLYTIFLINIFCFSLLQAQQRNNDNAYEFDFECIDPNGCPRIDLIIHNGLDGFSGGQAISNADEESVGALTVANLNDTDSDGQTDNIDNNVTGGDIDLMMLEINLIGQINSECTEPSDVNLIITSERVRIWDSSNKSNEIIDFNFDVNNLPLILYIEAIQVSTSYQDIEIQVEYAGVTQDAVKATAIWAEPQRSFFTRQTANGLPNNPIPGGTGLTNLDGANLASFIADHQSDDNSRYGIGLMKSTSLGVSNLVDNFYGGRILMEFSILPTDLPNDIELSFDITRRKESETVVIQDGQSGFQIMNSRQFPSMFDQPNDDAQSGDDEDNLPSQAKIYSFDGPATETFTPSFPFRVKKITFQEFVRIGFSTSAFPEDDNGQPIRGSRGSVSLDWYSITYLKRGGIGTTSEYEPMNSSLNYSKPIMTSGSGNGNININVFGDASSESYSLLYQESNSSWTLFLDNTTAITTITDSGNSNWVLTDPNKVEVQINNGSTPFTNGTALFFSILNTDNPRNEVNLGSINVFDGNY